jgi:hypothetical protein
MVQDTTTTNNEPDKKRSLRRSWKASGPVAKWTVIFAGMAALATLTYAAIAGWQLFIMGRQLTALIESNEINRDALYSVQRAFITTTKMSTEVPTYTNLDGSGKPTKLLEFTAHWQNEGNTPAIGVVTAFGCVEKPDEITEDEFLGVGTNSVFVTSALGPKENIDSQTIRRPESFATENPGTPRFFWGWMVYRDIFPKTKAHVTEFCYRVMEINKRQGGKEEYRFNADACKSHNCVDEFCEDYATVTGLSPK